MRFVFKCNIHTNTGLSGLTKEPCWNIARGRMHWKQKSSSLKGSFKFDIQLESCPICNLLRSVVVFFDAWDYATADYSKVSVNEIERKEKERNVRTCYWGPPKKNKQNAIGQDTHARTHAQFPVIMRAINASAYKIEDRARRRESNACKDFPTSKAPIADWTLKSRKATNSFCKAWTVAANY